MITSLHDFHVTHTTIHYNNTNETIEITIKVAIEDLERVVGGKEGNELRIGTVNENKLVDKLIIDYFSNRLKISLNNWNATYQWVGKEISENYHDLYLYFEILDCNQNGIVNSLTVENSVFTEIIFNQTNIVLIEFGENNYNLTYTKDHNKQSIDLKH